MTEINTATETTTATEQATTSKEAKFPLSRLAENSQELFGVSSTVFAGATHKLAADKSYSVSDVKAKIEKWLNTPIKLRKERKEGQ